MLCWGQGMWGNRATCATLTCSSLHFLLFYFLTPLCHLCYPLPLNRRCWGCCWHIQLM